MEERAGIGSTIHREIPISCVGDQHYKQNTVQKNEMNNKLQELFKVLIFEDVMCHLATRRWGHGCLPSGSAKIHESRIDLGSGPGS